MPQTPIPSDIRTKMIAGIESHLAIIRDDAKRLQYIADLEKRLEQVRAAPATESQASVKSGVRQTAFDQPHQPPPTLSVRQPGDLLALVIYQITKTAPCSMCNDMKEKMNGWGWLGCWQNREEIVTFLQKQAESRGVVIEKATVASLLVAAIKTAWKGMPEIQP